MTDSNVRYVKLARTSTFQMQTYYLGEDHILLVEGGYREKYRKISYRDIEAILYQPTSASKISGAFCGIVGFLGLLGAAASTFNNGLDESTIFLWILVVACICIFTLVQIGGGSVIFGVQSAVQTLRIQGINTRKKAERALSLISERVIAAQGELTQEALIEAAERHRIQAVVDLKTGQPDLAQDAIKPVIADTNPPALNPANPPDLPSLESENTGSEKATQLRSRDSRL